MLWWFSSFVGSLQAHLRERVERCRGVWSGRGEGWWCNLTLSCNWREFFVLSAWKNLSALCVSKNYLKSCHTMYNQYSHTTHTHKHTPQSPGITLRFSGAGSLWHQLNALCPNMNMAKLKTLVNLHEFSWVQSIRKTLLLVNSFSSRSSWHQTLFFSRVCVFLEIWIGQIRLMIFFVSLEFVSNNGLARFRSHNHPTPTHTNKKTQKLL
jgi:hypothetical protein